MVRGEKAISDDRLRAALAGKVWLRTCLILRCALFGLILVTSSSAVVAAEPVADAAADYVVERIRERMTGVHGWMMTDDFVFDYYEDVFTAEPTCMIRMPRLYETRSSMPRVIDLPGGAGFLIGDEGMLTLILAPQSLRLWIPDPDGDGPGIRFKVSSSTDVLEIGRGQWTTLGDESGYLIADTEMTLSILEDLYSANALQVNPNDSPTELQNYNTRGYFTAMNTALRLCPDHLPETLVRGDRNPRADERVYNALEPSENDQLLDLRGQPFPIDTPFGQLAITYNAADDTKTLTINGQPLDVTNSVVEPQALINLSGASYVLVSHVCTRCGNAYDAGNLLELARLNEGYRRQTHALDKAYILPRSLERMQMSLGQETATLRIPDVGTYRLRQLDRTLSIDYEVAPIHDEIAALEEQRKTLQRQIVETHRDEAPRRLIIDPDNPRSLLTGKLHRHATPFRSVFRPDEALPAYTLELDPPVILLDHCDSTSPRYHFDIVSSDPVLAEKAGQSVSVLSFLRCNKWNKLPNLLNDFKVVDPESALAVAYEMRALESSLAESEASYTLASNAWRCTTSNPDGSESTDSYRFNDDGSFVSMSNGTRVSGLYARSGPDLQLTFTRIITQGRARAVNARTSARIEKLDDGELVFTSVDAKTSALRRVACRP